MKKSVFNISRIVLILVICCTSVIASSQDLKLNKKGKKEAREAERLKNYEAIGNLLVSRQFSYATYRTQSSTGIQVYNVIRFDGSKIFVRLENPQNTSGRFSGAADNTTPYIYPRTGLFFEGDIEHWELSKNSKNLSYTCKFELTTSDNSLNPGIDYEIIMNVKVDNSATLELSLRGGTMAYSNYTGYLRTL